uniref:Uncharacterized protein n=1 Tax=Anguilla anguilla TaxID=7936 RepID=A0A0E9W5U4_ANGAN
MELPHCLLHACSEMDTSKDHLLSFQWYIRT